MEVDGAGSTGSGAAAGQAPSSLLLPFSFPVPGSLIRLVAEAEAGSGSDGRDGPGVSTSSLQAQEGPLYVVLPGGLGISRLR